MDTSGASGVKEPIIDVAGSMVEIKVKTLDSQTYTLRVDKYVPVPQLKEQIAIVTGVVTDQQRLICRGKVLKDDELLSAYHVEDGHTLHLVIRQPHQSPTSTGQMGPESAARNTDNNSSTGTSGNRGVRTVVFETVNIGQGDHTSAPIAQIISSVLHAAFATTSSGSIAARSDQRDVGVSASGDASSSEPVSRQVPHQSVASMGPQQPNVIPDSLTTINQYLSFMRDEFSREGFGITGQGQGYRNDGSTSVRSSVLQSHTEPLQPSQSGLPNPTSLAASLLLTRELLNEQAGRYISQFARRIGDHETVTDPTMRTGLQNNVIRSGILLRDLGSLLLELGRTTMTLWLGQAPSEAVINAGPAVYISGTGPNPVMVQPVPFYPGSSFGISRTGSLSGHSLQSDALNSAFLPANIGIRFRSGRTTLGSAVNQDEQAASQQHQEQTDPTRNVSGTNNAFQAFQGVSDASFAGTSGVRVVPIRTVVAVPAGVARAPSNPAGSAVGLIYPVISRVEVSNGSGNDAVGNQASTETTQGVHNANQHPNIPPLPRQNLESNSVGTINDVTFTIPSLSVENLSTNGAASQQGTSRSFTSGQQGEQNSHQASSLLEQLASRVVGQFLRTVYTGDEVQVDGSSHEEFNGGPAANQVGQDENPQSERTEEHDAIFFSNMVRHLMPFISQGTSPGQDGSPSNSNSTSHNPNDASSSQHLRDPPEAPSPKRQKREDC